LDLASQLIERGVLRSPRWQHAFATVSRESFLRQVYIPCGRDEFKAIRPDDRLARQFMHRDVSLVTQLNGDSYAWTHSLATGPIRGIPTSASTRPSLIASMVEALDIQDGHRVLEIGTGTGYTAGLLCAGVGAANVTTVEIDPDLAAQAQDQLSAAGFDPLTVGVDGTAGYPPAAPHDRILASCAMPDLPEQWLAQCRPGTLILLPLHRELDPGALLLLTVHHDGAAHGQFLPECGRLLPSRTVTSVTNRWLATERSPGTRRTTNIPSVVLGNTDFLLFAALRLPGVRMSWPSTNTSDGLTTWLVDRGGSWAMHSQCDDHQEVEQGGQRRLWDELEHTYHTWTQAGRPGRARLGLSVTPDHRTVWVDHPGSRLHWTLPIEADWTSPADPWSTSNG
jgi:protein-L-isoaspartate O-methyltransferase